VSPPDRELVAEARATTKRVARTFALACRLLPRDVRDDVHLLYLVFRTLDDLVDDGEPDAAGRVAAVEAWCRTGEHATREALILGDLATRYELPRQAFLDFCAGMRHDLEGRPVTTEEELDTYCYRVAGTVGLVMASVLGVERPQALDAAVALGMAMQRTNVLRDIDEDASIGRTYLAEATIRRLGPPEPGRRERLVRDQIRRADELYDRGMAGIGELLRGRRAVRAAAVMYREILRQIERDGYGRRSGRAVVPTRRKLLLAARTGVAG
jgi:phytoene synthase